MNLDRILEKWWQSAHYNAIIWSKCHYRLVLQFVYHVTAWKWVRYSQPLLYRIFPLPFASFNSICWYRNNAPDTILSRYFKQFTRFGTHALFFFLYSHKNKAGVIGSRLYFFRFDVLPLPTDSRYLRQMVLWAIKVARAHIKFNSVINFQKINLLHVTVKYLFPFFADITIKL